MELRTVGVTIACLLAFLGGMALGWVHGSTSPTSPVAAATVQAPVEADSEPAVGVTEAAGFIGDPYGGKVFALGDSVLAGAQPCLKKLGYSVDARQSRQVDAGIQLLRRKVNKLPARLVIHLGTNGGVTTQQLDTMMAMLGTDRLVVWSTIQLPDDPDRYTYEERTNTAIEDLAGRYANVRILDWNALTEQSSEWIYLEGIHMTAEGCAGYARLVDGIVRAPSPFGNEM
ncbi:MAG: hypothetical protein ACKOAW_05300 [Actinomycetota bacterium]